MNVDQSDKKQLVASSFLDDLNGAIRENPVAAGLIGVGVLWMFVGAHKGPLLSTALTPRVTRALGSATEAGGSAATQITESARQVGDSISSGVQGAGKFVRDTLTAGYEATTSRISGPITGTVDAAKVATQTVAQSGIQVRKSLENNLRDTLERQPLFLGAIGLAMGATIASVFPATRVEREFMGETGAAAKQKIHRFASDTSDFVKTKSEQVLHDVKREADAQGLTTSAAKDALKGTADKVKSVAKSTRESVTKHLS